MQRFKNDEGGFTLIELLVVILIVGILAAIALPTFLGQQKKGQDSEAKSNARNLVTHLESCFADTQAYNHADCSPPQNTGLPIGAGSGQVAITAAGATTYTIQALSKSGSAATFTISRADDGVITRTCGAAGQGGCKSDSTW
jgi:type IV pilus assembly protein PilA